MNGLPPMPPKMARALAKAKAEGRRTRARFDASGWQIEIGKAPKQKRALCGASTRTRNGAPCRAHAVAGANRCRNHGGLSTGPKTAPGRAKCAAAASAANRKRRGTHYKPRARKYDPEELQRGSEVVAMVQAARESGVRIQDFAAANFRAKVAAAAQAEKARRASTITPADSAS